MSSYSYQDGQRLQWIEPEAGRTGISVGQSLHANGLSPIVDAIVVVMENGPYCGIPHFAVICDGKVARKYSAHACFMAGPLQEQSE